MIKKVTKIGNSHGIILDASFLDSANIKVGDEFRVTVHDGGSIVFTPLKSRPSDKEITKAIKATMTDYARTMKKLA